MSTIIKMEVFQEQGNETLLEISEKITNPTLAEAKQVDKDTYTELMSNKDFLAKSLANIKKHDNDELLIVSNAAYNFLRITHINNLDISSFVKKVKEDDFGSVDLAGFNSFHDTDVSDYESCCDCVDTFGQDNLTSIEFLLG